MRTAQKLISVLGIPVADVYTIPGTQFIAVHPRWFAAIRSAVASQPQFARWLDEVPCVKARYLNYSKTLKGFSFARMGVQANYGTMVLSVNSPRPVWTRLTEETTQTSVSGWNAAGYSVEAEGAFAGTVSAGLGTVAPGASGAGLSGYANDYAVVLKKKTLFGAPYGPLRRFYPGSPPGPVRGFLTDVVPNNLPMTDTVSTLGINDDVFPGVTPGDTWLLLAAPAVFTYGELVTVNDSPRFYWIGANHGDVARHLTKILPSIVAQSDRINAQAKVTRMLSAPHDSTFIIDAPGIEFARLHSKIPKGHALADIVADALPGETITTGLSYVQSRFAASSASSADLALPASVVFPNPTVLNIVSETSFFMSGDSAARAIDDCTLYARMAKSKGVALQIQVDSILQVTGLSGELTALIATLNQIASSEGDDEGNGGVTSDGVGDALPEAVAGAIMKPWSVSMFNSAKVLLEPQYMEGLMGR